MPWVKLDDHFDEHAKLDNISLVGVGLWVTALAYCNRNLTDGFVPRNVARRLGSLEVVDERGVAWTLGRSSGMAGDDLDHDWIIAQLLDAGLWEEVYEESGRLQGYRIHDFDQYQPSRAEVEAERARNAERQRRYRGRHAESEDVERNGGSNAVSNGVTPSSVTDLSQGRYAGPVPVPVPVPDPVPEPEPEPTGKDDVRARARGVAKPPAPAASQEQPYAFYEVLCDELAAAPESPPPTQQLGVAKRLVKKGHSTEDVRGCLRFLLSQDWRTGLVDLRTVESEIDAWKLNGRPAMAKARASPSKRSGGLSPSDLFQHADRLRAIETNGRVQRD